MALPKLVSNFRTNILIPENSNQLLLLRRFTQLIQCPKHNGENGILKDDNKIIIKNYLIQIRRMKSKKVSDKDCEVEGKKGPTSCHRDLAKAKEKCVALKLPKWPDAGCLKVCLPCCRPIDIPVRCDASVTEMNLCSGIQYKYPGYAEMVEKVDCNIRQTDCCKEDLCRQIFKVGQMSQLLRLKEHQKRKLGLPKGDSRYFSTYSVQYAKKEKEKEKSAKSDEETLKKLPCIVQVESKLGATAKKSVVKGDCKKLCMPCCKPARDPPDCFFPYVKPKCKKLRAPRPAFSECQADKMKICEPCECTFVTLKKCRQVETGKDKKKKKDEKQS